jgi:two-component system, chemotaxis family, protein-glutamate methylesterase/glutaminase
MNNQKIKVMIVDDSPVARDLLTFIIESDPRLMVTGYAIDGSDALTQLKYQNPDVITMDLMMPKMSGFEATQKIMESSPTPIIIVTATYQNDEVEKSFKAIQMGALAILPKPGGPGDPLYVDKAQEIRETIKIVSGMKLIKRRDPFKFKNQILQKQKPTSYPDKKNKVQAVAIGASLGGPQALAKILSELPALFPVPIFIVQHISTGFINGLVSWLSGVTDLKVSLAKDKQVAQPGCIYIAPETADMEISTGHIIHLKKAMSNTVHPSIGPLFSSMARTYGPLGIGVILTGMGKDGAAEMRQMKDSGAWTIAQDEESSVVFGMPKEAIALGGVRSILPLDEISSTLKNLVGI